MSLLLYRQSPSHDSFGRKLWISWLLPPLSQWPHKWTEITLIMKQLFLFFFDLYTHTYQSTTYILLTIHTHIRVPPISQAHIGKKKTSTAQKKTVSTFFLYQCYLACCLQQQSCNLEQQTVLLLTVDHLPNGHVLHSDQQTEEIFNYTFTPFALLHDCLQ